MSVEYKDYYKVLGVAKNATKEEIAKAYKKLARKYHPDLNKDDKKAEDRFKEVNEANEVLKDPEKRKMYDHLGPNWQNGQNFQRPPGFEHMNFSRGGAPGGGFGGGGFSDFFETLFGGGGFGGQGAQFGGFGGQGGQFGGQGGGFSQAPRRGNDVEASLTLTLEEAYSGGKKSVSLQGPAGRRSLEVAVPAGVKPGARIRLTGQGEEGRGGGNGDLYLKVQIAPHQNFSLDDADVIYDLLLAPWEAVLGAKVRVPTLTGAIDLNIAPGTGSGKKLRIRGKGLGSGQTKGDQLVRIGIAVPDTLSPEEQELWAKLQEISQFTPRGD